MDLTQSFDIEKIEKDNVEKFKDEVIIENYFNIHVDDKKVATLMCTPSDLECLVIGHLYSLDLINSIEDIISIDLDTNDAYVKIHKNISEKNDVEPGVFELDRYEIFNLSKTFQNNSEVFKRTGGAHSCGLIDNYRIIKFEEDVARNNAVDKLIGYIIKHKIDISDKFIFTSCRISDQIIDKILKIGFNLIVSQSSPTSVSVEMAKDRNVNLIGFARNERFNIYNKCDNLVII